MVKNLATWLEKRFTKNLQQHYKPLTVAKGAGLKSGSHITVIGGGISGSAFVRQLALEAHKAGKDIYITLVNSTNCNYCGGLITNVALETLAELSDLHVPQDLVLKEVDQCIYINKAGHVKINLSKPLTATLRTSRFGYLGFDDSIKNRITQGLPREVVDRIQVIEPTLAKRVKKAQSGKHNWQVVLSKRNPDNSNMILETDVVVIACGFRALNRPMLKEFHKLTGFQPPPTIPASVTEVDTSNATKNFIENRMFIIDGIIPDCVVAFIPKGPQWLTLTSLNKKLTAAELKQLFAHPQVRKFIELPDPENSLRCHTVCGASVYVGPSSKFYGDNWLVIGDLTGYGRILKDGYFAAFLGAQLAAETLLYLGSDRQSLSKGYHDRLKHFSKDNICGRYLFNLNNWLNQQDWFSKLFMAAAKAEGREKQGAYIHAAIRALATGELSYRLITLLFVLGLVRYPFTVIHDLLGRVKGR